MAIIALQTDLRKLTYTDTPVLGDPVITKNIPGGKSVVDTNSGKGSYNSLSKQVEARRDDLERVKALISAGETPQGSRFTANQALLAQQETISNLQKGNVKAGLRSAISGVASQAKTLASTLAQVPVSGTGIHFVNGSKVGKEYLKGGGNPVGNFLRQTIETSRAADGRTAVRGVPGVGLQGHELVLAGQNVPVNFADVDSNGIASRVDDNGRLSTTLTFDPVIDGSVETNPVDKYKSQTDRIKKGGFATRGDFSTGYKRGDERVKPVVWVNYSSDPTSADPILRQDRRNIKDITTEQEEESTDIIPFEFQIFDPSFPEEPVYLYFKALLDNFGDTFNGEWNSTKYIGRAENLYNYTGFDRNIDFNFKVAAFTRSEILPIYNKLNYLAGTTAPSYNDNRTFMRGVFCKITVGDYLKAVPGFFTSLSLSWSNSYPWEIGFGVEEGTNNLIADDVLKNPTILEVGVNYKPVHNFNPSIGSPFISDLTYARE